MVRFGTSREDMFSSVNPSQTNPNPRNKTLTYFYLLTLSKMFVPLGLKKIEPRVWEHFSKMKNKNLEKHIAAEVTNRIATLRSDKPAHYPENQPWVVSKRKALFSMLAQNRPKT